MVSGSISAPTVSEVAERIEYLGLLPVETIVEARGATHARSGASLFSRPRAEDVTVFTRDLALLLKAGARIDDALDLLAVDIDIGRLRGVVAQIRGRVLAGESLSEALAHHPLLFPSMYLALVRVGEVSGTLDHVLDVLGNERNRGEAMRRKVADALRYPAFVLLAACGVLSFFLLFVVPQFAAVLQDFKAKPDPIVAMLFGLSQFGRAHLDVIEVALAAVILCGWLVLRRAAIRARIAGLLSRLPLLRSVVRLNRTALFCRNLGILLGSGVPLTMALRILVDMLGSTDNGEVWR
jgi:general secretion pathway protein F